MYHICFDLGGSPIEFEGYSFSISKMLRRPGGCPGAQVMMDGH